MYPIKSLRSKRLKIYGNQIGMIVWRCASFGIRDYRVVLALASQTENDFRKKAISTSAQETFNILDMLLIELALVSPAAFRRGAIVQHCDRNLGQIAKIGEPTNDLKRAEHVLVH
jgi:hypothetical protein